MKEKEKKVQKGLKMLLDLLKREKGLEGLTLKLLEEPLGERKKMKVERKRVDFDFVFGNVEEEEEMNRNKVFGFSVFLM